MRLSRKGLRAAALVLGGVLLLVALYFVMAALEERLLPAPADGEALDPVGTVIRGSDRYTPKRTLTSLLVLGIDEAGTAQSSQSYNNPGQADFIALLLFDSADQSCRVLQLNRDTMADIPILGVGDQPAGTRRAQLALAHTYGSGLADSCQNALDAVSNFLYGIPIQHYLSLRMDAVAALCDLAGGVPVEIHDDFSAVDATLVRDTTVTLTGRQALTYLRARSNMAEPTNLARMERQKQFLLSFAERLREAEQTDAEFPARVFAATGEYVVTDLTAQSLSDIFRRFSEYSLAELVSPAGEARQGKEFIEFYVEETALQELVLRLFYNKQPDG